ncbi:MAG: universal stress protein [Desulfobacterales bacterium]|nr:universal stress protein [Desulfobacterales bacterium]
MKKKILVAVDGSRHASTAVGYAARMAGAIGDVEYLLIHIQPGISQYLLDEAEKIPKVKSELGKIIKKNKAAGLALLEAHRAKMVKGGVDAVRIEIQTRPRLVSVADDLLALSHAGSYDAIVVGRRGIGYLHEMVMGSVAANLANNSQITPIWIVDGDVSGEKTLLAVDGSSRSLRALDHLAFILGGQSENRIHMIHVQPWLRDCCEIDMDEPPSPEVETAMLDGDRKCMRDFSSQAKAVLGQYGFDDDRIDLTTVAARVFAGKAILEAAGKGEYGTVVIGKGGESKSTFLGSVSRKVLQKASNLAVWIVP